ncbi:MAG TPA: hypothetical protein VJ023_18460 [Pyrinomonadaceae bacterium]|nr:hypothetical protein [Pyrinomonadaceae bacterium]
MSAVTGCRYEAGVYRGNFGVYAGSQPSPSLPWEGSASRPETLARTK